MSAPASTPIVAAATAAAAGTSSAVLDVDMNGMQE